MRCAKQQHIVSIGLCAVQQVQRVRTCLSSVRCGGRWDVMPTTLISNLEKLNTSKNTCSGLCARMCVCVCVCVCK